MIFNWEQRAKQHCYKKRKHIRYLNIFNIINISTLLSADAISAILLSVPWTKVEIPNFSLLHFLGGSAWLMKNSLCLCDARKGRSYVNSNVSVSSIFNNGQFYLKYYFLHRRNPPALSPLKEIQLSVNCYVSVFIFHQNAKTITFLYIYRTWRNVPKPS